MGGRWGGNIKGKRVNRNGASSGQIRRDWTTALGRLLTVHDCAKCGSREHQNHPTPSLPLETLKENATLA